MRLVTPVSHLFEFELAGREILAASDALEARPERMLTVSVFDPYVTHVHISEPDLDLNLPWAGVHRRRVFESISRFPRAEMVTFHVSRDCISALLDELGRYTPVGPCMDRDTMLRNCLKNTAWLKSTFRGLAFGIENVNFYDTGCYEVATSPAFIRDVVQECELHWLFDVAHAEVSAWNRHEPLDGYLEALPWQALCQIHVSKIGQRVNGEAFDAHQLPGVDSLLHVGTWAPSAWASLPVTIEYYGDAPRLINALNLFRGSFNDA